MSNARYLEIDSTYRDRTIWPSPANFEVLISQTGRKGPINAVDPVSLGVPITCWTGNLFNSNTPGTSVTVTVDSIVGVNLIAGVNLPSSFVILAPIGSLQQTSNYYVNAVANDTTIFVKRQIISYEYIGTDSGGVNDRAIITVNNSFSDAFADGDTIVINDPTDLSNTTEAFLFVPNGRSGTNAYTGCIIYNETLKESRPIASYDTVTHLISPNTSTASGGPLVGWSILHNYCIRKQNPIESTTIAVGTTFNTVALTAGSAVDDIYNGQFLRILAPIYGNGVIEPQNQTRRIVDYDGATMTATVTPPFTNSAGVFTAPTIGDGVEILSFSYDNLYPFVYTGSLVSQQEMVCYEIELLNLSLPNKTLNVGVGSRIAFYPYVYVELSNVSGASAGMKNTIYSNNPNSTRMVFRATIDDVPNPIISSFVKVDGDGMVQTLKFKPNDNLRFSVRLSNGEVYEVIEPENFSPLPPNPEIQISALFSIKRL